MIPINPIGRITNDLELKTIQSSGVNYVNFGLAVSDGYGYKQKTIFFDCSIYGDDAVRMVKAKAKKGSLIQVNGAFGVSEFPRQNDGGTGYKLKIKVNGWSYIPGTSADSGKNSDGRNIEDGTANEQPVSATATPGFPPNNYEQLNLDDDELPF